MKVAVYRSNSDVRIEERPVPGIGAGEVLLRIRASGICGSDLAEWYRRPKAPVVLGHEVAGEVVAVGEGVSGFQAGDRIFATHHVPCGECRYCRSGHPSVCDTLRSTHFDPGGFSEYVRLPRPNVERGTIRLPDDVSFEEGSFIEPLGCAVRGQDAARVEPGASVLVLGSGVAGLLHAQLALARGASPVIVTDVDPYRLRAALRVGVHGALDAGAEGLEEAFRGVNAGRLADRVIVCTAAPAAVSQAFRLVERGGTVLLFALLAPGARAEVPLQDLFWKEATLTTSYAASGRELEESLDLIGTGAVDVRSLITHRLPLAEAAEGFRIAASAKDCLKVLLQP